MGSLLITMIGIVFCAMLLAAGVSVIKPTAYIEHNQANNNSAQVQSLVTDYSNIVIATGHRPTYADYAAMFPSGASVNSEYSYDAGNQVVRVPSTVEGLQTAQSGVNKWQYYPASCYGNSSDCFCLALDNSSDLTYKSLQVSALQQMNTPTQSRLGLSTTGCTDSNPNNVPTTWQANPTNYYLIVQLGGASSAVTPPPLCSAIDIQWSSCPTTCGSSVETATSWICSCGSVIRGQSLCTPPTGPTCSNFSGCTYIGTYGLCNAACGQAGTQPVLTCTRSDGTPAALSNCSPQPCVKALCPPPAITYVAVNPVYACSSTCGTGTQNLVSYTCNGIKGFTVVSSTNVVLPATSNCTPPASTNGSCEGTSSCQWTATNGACQCNTSSTTGGTETITYTCTAADGVTAVNSSDCTGTQGPASQNCTPPTGQCNGNTYTASCPTYGACSATCGVGTQPVNYTCTDQNNNIVDNSNCGVANGTRACSNYSGCTYMADPIYQTCNSGGVRGFCRSEPQLLRSWSCVRSDGTSVDDSYCSSPPSSQLGCLPYDPVVGNDGSGNPIYECPVGTPGGYTWVDNIQYGACSNSCGIGTQALTSWSCFTNTYGVNGNQQIDQSNCDAPASSQSCTNYNGCTYTSAGSSTSFTCTRSDGVAVDPSYCIPPTGTSCSPGGSTTSPPSSPSPNTGTWTPTTGACSATCGTGTQTTSYTCTGGTCSTPQPASTTSSCSVYSGCTYSVSSSYGTCDCTGNQALTSWACTRSDGTNMGEDTTHCTAPASTKTCTAPNTCSSDGRCDNTTVNGCTVGTVLPSSESNNGLTATWICAGTNGGNNSVQCSTPYTVPESGSCNQHCIIGAESQDNTTQQCFTGDVPADSYCINTETWVCTTLNGSTAGGSCIGDPQYAN